MSCGFTCVFAKNIIWTGIFRLYMVYFRLWWPNWVIIWYFEPEKPKFSVFWGIVCFVATFLQVPIHKKNHMKKSPKRFHRVNRASFLSLSNEFEDQKFIPKISPKKNLECTLFSQDCLWGTVCVSCVSVCVEVVTNCFSLWQLSRITMIESMASHWCVLFVTNFYI